MVKFGLRTGFPFSVNGRPIGVAVAAGYAEACQIPDDETRKESGRGIEQQVDLPAAGDENLYNDAGRDAAQGAERIGAPGREAQQKQSAQTAEQDAEDLREFVPQRFDLP